MLTKVSVFPPALLFHVIVFRVCVMCEFETWFARRLVGKSREKHSPG